LVAVLSHLSHIRGGNIPQSFEHCLLWGRSAFHRLEKTALEVHIRLQNNAGRERRRLIAVQAYEEDAKYKIRNT
jgi:hypothetical protein